MFDQEAFFAALETAALGRHLDYREVVESTMDLALEAAMAGAEHGTLVLAEEQTAGRGRRGRDFHSPRGENLYFTVVVRSESFAVPRLPFLAPLAVAEACAQVHPGVAIKWPNDIWIGERKVSGMLIDAHSTGGVTTALLGIGINVNGDPERVPGLEGIATSLARAARTAVSRETLLARLLNELERLERLPAASLIEQYRAHSNTLGRRVRVFPAIGEAFEGSAIGITDMGALNVALDDGTVRPVEAGDVSLRPAVD